MPNGNNMAAADDGIHSTQQMKIHCDALNMYHNSKCS